MIGGSNKQSIKGSKNIQGKKVNIGTYNNLADQEEVDFGIIEDIFNYVRENIKNILPNNKAKPENLIKANRKINKNFLTDDDRDEVRNLYTFALQKTALIEKKILGVRLFRSERHSLTHIQPVQRK